jgi:hypothetical protein
MPTYPSSRGGGTRGGDFGRGPAPREPRTNLVPYVAAGVVVVLIVGVLIAMSGGKKKAAPPTSTPAPAAPAPEPVATPTKPGEAPYPILSAAKQEEGRNLVRTFEQAANDADRLYKESLKAKEAGDEAAWQSKLGEAATLLHGINDRWNEFIASLPSSRDYDEEQVARHYFPKESGQVARWTKLLAAMKSDKR